jgi:predicted NACHT family NTPase
MRRSVHLLALVLLLAVGKALPHDEADAKAINKLIEQLGSDHAKERQAAAKQLEAIGESAVEALRKASKDHIDPDVRLRAAVLIAAINKGVYEEIRSIKGKTNGYWINRVAFTPDGKQAVAAGGAVIVYDLENSKELYRTLELQNARNGLALSKDGKYFLTGHQRDKVVRLGEVATGKEVQTFEGHTQQGVHGVALSPDGTLAASGGDDGTLRLWEVKTGKELRQCQGITDHVRSLAFSPDGKRVASGHYGPKSEFLVRLWDVENGKEVRSFKGHKGDVTAVAFLPEGDKLLSASMDGTLRLWDATSDKELKMMKHDKGAYDAAVSPDGKRALSAGFGDNKVRLWDLTTGKELHCFEGHTTAVLGVAFSPDGKQALSSDANNTVRLWRLAK